MTIEGKYSKYGIDVKPIQKMRRCTKCVLPHTMPFIEFDEGGVCNYCRTYKKHETKDVGTLLSLADRLRKKNGGKDSLAFFSGGRDSSYGLHYMVKELGLNPIAYSYRWGMETDIILRNQKRMCDALGVELVGVDANITRKRDNIRKNIVAWLKKPDLGMVVLFTAGDKQFFYHGNRLKKRYGLDSIFLTTNPFERTHFKVGFGGIKPAIFNTDALLDSYLEKLGYSEKSKLAGYYLKQYAANPAYINASLWDTFGATLSNFVIPHEYTRLFDYVKWNEKEVDGVLADRYGWEKSPYQEGTWRIGDGTAPFYNYVFYLVAGFTENDTLRSNQIREGMMTRAEAMELIFRDNAPSFEPMQWYFDVLGLDMEVVLDRVNEIPRLYERTL